MFLPYKRNLISFKNNKPATIGEIIVIVILAIAIIIYFARKNARDEENTNPDLTDR